MSIDSYVNYSILNFYRRCVNIHLSKGAIKRNDKQDDNYINIRFCECYNILGRQEKKEKQTEQL